MQSMTGYGKAEYNKDGIILTVEIRTVNNRFLDIVPKYPRVFLKYDDLIRKTVSSYVSRGRLELFVTLKDLRETGKSYVLDSGLAKGYYDAYQRLKKEFVDLEDDLKLSALLRIPDVLTPDGDKDDTVYEDVLVETLKTALVSLNEMRNTEGEKLKADLLSRLSVIEDLLAKIKERAPIIQKVYAQKLAERISDYLGDVKYDEARFLQEVALFADKSNIDEEITRLYSHVSQFKTIVNCENAGRKLDFLIQEFNREANTICSKSNDVEITDCALKLKCEIEKIREQIQNVE